MAKSLSNNTGIAVETCNTLASTKFNPTMRAGLLLFVNFVPAKLSSYL